MRKNKVIFIVIFLIVCITPILFLNKQEDFLSDIDNRYLTNISEVDDFQSLSNYIDDRIGGRRRMIEFYHKFNKCLFNTYDHDEITEGKNGYLFPETEDNVVFTDYHEDFISFVEGINEYCEDRGIKFYFVFNPSKTSILSEYLPDGINFNCDWIDEFINKLKKRGITVVDNYRNFIEYEDRESLFNKEYDAAHWNDYGALFGTNNLFKEMKDDFDNIRLLEVGKDFYEGYEDIEYLPNTVIKCDEKVVKLNLESEYIDKTEEYLDGILLQEEFNYFHYYSNENRELPKILMFQGSYYDASGRSKFIVPNASDYIGVHNYRNIENYDYYINIFQPDCVIFEVAEYTLKEYYFSQWAMQNKKTVEAYDFSLPVNKINNEVEIDINLNGAYYDIILTNVPHDIDYCYLRFDDDRVLELEFQEQGKYAAKIDTSINGFNEDEIMIVYKNDGMYYSPNVIYKNVN